MNFDKEIVIFVLHILDFPRFVKNRDVCEFINSFLFLGAFNSRDFIKKHIFLYVNLYYEINKNFFNFTG